MGMTSLHFVLWLTNLVAPGCWKMVVHAVGAIHAWQQTKAYQALPWSSRMLFHLDPCCWRGQGSINTYMTQQCSHSSQSAQLEAATLELT